MGAKPLRYGSVCSGIEAASVAWEPLGWEPAWFSEIEAFPAALLDHYWPSVDNLGDMLALPAAVESWLVEAPDVLVGGTPCQSFSLAGPRGSLSDERGALTLAYVEALDRIDEVKQQDGEPECIAVWENVPGVLNTKDNAFGCLLAGLAGEDRPFEPTGKKWSNAGCVFGPQRTVAWRVLDAQHFGVAQRRRRVFVVASARDGFDPTAVLFESEGVRRDSPPSRESGENAAADVAPSVTASGRGFSRAGESRGQDPVVAVPIQNATRGKSQNGLGVACPGDPMYTLDRASQHGVAVPYQHVAHCLNAGGMGRIDYETESFVCQAVTGDIAHARNTANNGKGCSGDGTGRGVPTIAQTVALRGREGGATAELGGGVATALRASSGGGDKPHVLTVHGTQDPICSDTVAHALGRNHGGENALFVPTLAVRRLTPVECERLQGFPDGWTAIPFRRKDVAADGNRYKAIGNSMAVPVMHWIGRRIAMHLQPEDCFDDL